MDKNKRLSSRLSMETDSTIRDIWQLSQQAQPMDPQAMQQALDIRRQVRHDIRPTNRLSFGNLDGDYSMAEDRRSVGPMGGLPTLHFGDSLLEGESPQLRQDEVSRAMRRRSANVNLQKSLQLLDEAVGTPGPILRTAKKTPAALRHSTFTPKKVPGSRFDVSATMGLPTPGMTSMTPGSLMQGSFGESGVGVSSLNATRGSLAPVETSGFGFLDEDVTTTNVALLLEEDPGLAASTALFGEFLNSLRDHPAKHQVFDLLSNYEDLCEVQVQMLKKLVKRATPGQEKFYKVESMLRNLDQERCTWRLIYSLYKDRMRTDENTEEDMDINILPKYQSDHQIVEALYDKDTTVRHGQIVIDWLEKKAEEDLDQYYEKIQFFTDQTGAWENTLHVLKQKKGGIPSGIDRPIVHEMDPDAPIRQGKPLADLDEEDEVRLLRYMFACIRAGQLEKAQGLCVKCGQPWRAATLEGWKLYHDPNYDSGKGNLLQPVKGNPYRDVWKAVCWRMAEEEKFHMFERAVYAALSGNLEHILPACNNWEDYVWAHFRVMIDTRVEQEIRVSTSCSRPLDELPETYMEKRVTMDSLFRDIQASPEDHIRAQSKERFYIIQKYIILGDVDALIEEMYEWTKDDTNPPQQHLVRFMAHMVMFYRTIGTNAKEELCISILETYVRDLIEDKRTNLVAAYVATLPQNLQIEWYARFLEGVSDNEERKACLELAGSAGLNLPAITKLVVENIRSKSTGDVGTDGDSALEGATSEEDKQKIEAIDWLVFDPSQRAEAMRQANAVMRTFLATRKHAAAREVFKKIPPDSIDLIARLWQRQAGTMDLAAADENAIREYLCIKTYLDAQDSFNDWFEHYHNAKPVKPDKPAGANFTERVAYEHHEKQYEVEVERWQHSLMLQSKTTIDRIYNVLLFVDGGWMVDQRKDAPPEKSRLHQMMLLRQICLPRMCFLLHTVLHTTEQYQACLALADTIASEQHRLYTVFHRDELQKFLKKLCESSVSLLDKNLDPVGYPLA